MHIYIYLFFVRMWIATPLLFLSFYFYLFFFCLQAGWSFPLTFFFAFAFVLFFVRLPTMHLPLETFNQCLLTHFSSGTHTIGLLYNLKGLVSLIAQYVGENNFDFVEKTIQLPERQVYNILFHSSYPYMLAVCNDGVFVYHTCTWTIYSHICCRNIHKHYQFCWNPRRPILFCTVTEQTGIKYARSGGRENAIYVYSVEGKLLERYEEKRYRLHGPLHAMPSGEGFTVTGILDCPMTNKYTLCSFRYGSLPSKLQAKIIPAESVYFTPHKIYHVVYDTQRNGFVYFSTARAVYLFDLMTNNVRLIHKSSYYIDSIAFRKPNKVVVFNHITMRVFEISPTTNKVCSVYQQEHVTTNSKVHPVHNYITITCKTGYKVRPWKQDCSRFRKRKDPGQEPWTCTIQTNKVDFRYHPSYPLIGLFFVYYGKSSIHLLNLKQLKKTNSTSMQCY